jgi:phenylalanyl-tRNA synthetase beta subunit
MLCIVLTYVKGDVEEYKIFSAEVRHPKQSTLDREQLPRLIGLGYTADRIATRLHKECKCSVSAMAEAASL